MAGGDRGGGSAPSNSVASAAPLTTTDPLFIESALATETPWSDKHIGTNSISGILNDPDAKKAPPLKGMDSLPTIPSTQIRKIKYPTEFQPYLQSLADVLDRYQYNRVMGIAAATEGQPVLGNTDLDAEEDFYKHLSDMISNAGKSSDEAATKESSTSSSTKKRQLKKMFSQTAPSIETVPQIFFTPDFNLSSPQTFATVCESAAQQILQSHNKNLTTSMSVAGLAAMADPSSLATSSNAVLQDRLSHYLDTVEVHLIKEISRRSSSFFAALSNLQDLHAETLACVVQINDLRRKLFSVARSGATGALTVVRLKKRRGNVASLYGGIKLISEISRTQGMVAELISQQDFLGALDLVEGLVSLIRAGNNLILQQPGGGSSAAGTSSGGGAAGSLANGSALDDTKVVGGGGGGSNSGGGGLLVGSEAYAQLTSMGIMLEEMSARVKLLRHPSIVPRALPLEQIRVLASLTLQLAQTTSSAITKAVESECVQVLLNSAKTVAETVVPDADVANIPCDRREVETWEGQELPAFEWIMHIVKGTSSISSAVAAAADSEAGSLILGGASTGTPTIGGGTAKIVMPPIDEELKEELTSLVLALLRLDKLGPALQSYKDGLMRLIKNFSKKYYPPSFFAFDGGDDNDNSYNHQRLTSFSMASASSPHRGGLHADNSKKTEQQSALARNLRGMKFDAFFDMLTMVYIHLLYSIQSAAMVNDVIASILRDAQSQGVVIGTEGVRYLDRAGLTLGGATSTNASGAARRANIMKINDEEDDLGGGVSHEDINMPSSNTSTTASSANAAKASSVFDSNANMTDSTPAAASTYAQMLEESAEIVHAISDLAHMRCSKLVGVRAEQNAQLNPKDFYRLFGATWEFVRGGEALNGRPCFGLKSTMLSQAKSFLTVFHEEKTKQIALLIENEQWAQAEVPVDFQRIIEQIVASSAPSVGGGATSSALSKGGASSSDSGSAAKSTEELEDDGDITGSTYQESSAATVVSQADDQANSSKSLLVDGQRYFVVVCLLMFVKMLTDYTECIDHIPALTNDVLNRILEILKLFNSRICQVILGAGAMRSAGLKNITARHIALAAQSLGVVIAIIPHVKAGMVKRLPVRQQVLLTDFDRLLRDYREHQSELYAKLVSIMNERLVVHAKDIMKMNWDNPDPREFSAEENISVYMSTLVKETATLHKVLSKYLSSDTLKKVMADVFRTYALKLEDDLKKLDLFSSSAKNRLLMEVQFYISKMSALEGIDGPGNHLEVVVNNIKIKDRRMGGSGMSSQQPHQQPQSNIPGRTSGNSGINNNISSNSFEIDIPAYTPINTSPTRSNAPALTISSANVNTNPTSALPLGFNLPPPPSEIDDVARLPPPPSATSSSTSSKYFNNWLGKKQ